jgi:hypothetical protein
MAPNDVKSFLLEGTQSGPSPNAGFTRLTSQGPLSHFIGFEPATTTLLKVPRSGSPAQRERIFAFAEPAVRRNDSRYRFLARGDSLVWLRSTYHTM